MQGRERDDVRALHFVTSCLSRRRCFQPQRLITQPAGDDAIIEADAARLPVHRSHVNEAEVLAAMYKAQSPNGVRKT